MKEREALKLALEALIGARAFLESDAPVEIWSLNDKAITAIKEALAQPAVTESHKHEPVAWNVINPKGEIVATESNAIRGWARIQGYKPTVEGLLGFHEQGWRVVPAAHGIKE